MPAQVKPGTNVAIKCFYLLNAGIIKQLSIKTFIVKPRHPDNIHYMFAV